MSFSCSCAFRIQFISLGRWQKGSPVVQLFDGRDLKDHLVPTPFSSIPILDDPSACGQALSLSELLVKGSPGWTVLDGPWMDSPACWQ